MRKMKYAIILLLFFIMVGYAAVSVSLSIKGNFSVLSDVDDFKVYFSNATLNDERDLNLIKSETELGFDLLLEKIGTTYEISYDVTNGSSVFDAQIAVNCTSGDNYLSVVNDFDTSTNLAALSTRTGNLTLKKLKSNANDADSTYRITCSIDASPVERDSAATGEVVAPVTPLELAVGDVISIHGEKFNIISQTDDSVTMLAQYNITDAAPYKQTTTQGLSIFSETDGWEYTPGPKEIDVQTWGGDVKTVLNGYVDFLNAEYDVNVTGDLITLAELGEVGCTVPSGYAYGDGGWTCENSKYSDWLVNGQYWWTRSVDSEHSNFIWFVHDDGFIGGIDYYGNDGVRPVITIPIEYARMYAVKDYNIGDEVTIDTETFNVISETETTVTLLAQYNLGTDYRQSSTANLVRLFSETGWEYTPGPKEIDIQSFEGNAKLYVNEYVNYLYGITNDENINGNIITLAELKNLGCVFPANYTFSDDPSVETCANSPYKSWLINGQKTWTRSAETSNSTYVWMLGADGILTRGTYHNFLSIRPIITVSKQYL